MNTQTPRPAASVIVVSYKSRDLTLKCLASFSAAVQEKGWQVLVVDNGSHDGTAEAIEEAFPAVELIRTPENVGFAGGTNLGLARAAGAGVILLNSDVVVSPEVLGHLLAYLQHHPDVGAVSPRLVTAAGAPQSFAYGDDPSLTYLLRRGLYTLLGRGPLHDWQINREIDAGWVSGACMAVGRQVVEQVGPMDERFFLYFEDVDWCLRMRRAGWRVVYYPGFQVTHLGGASQPRRRDANQIYYKSMLMFYEKHYGRANLLALRLGLALYTRWHALGRDPVEDPP